MHQIAFGSRALPRPTGGATPAPLAAIWGLLLRGEEEGEGEGGRRGGERKVGVGEGEERKGTGPPFYGS